MTAEGSYTLAIVLQSSNLRHFRLMLRSVQRQSLVPAEVLYVGTPMTGSAVAQEATQHPLPLDGVEQSVVWCTTDDQDERYLNWSILDAIAHSINTPMVVMTSSDSVLHEDFARALLQWGTTPAIATSFPAVLSSELSSRLDENAVDRGEPFSSWWRVVFDGVLGQTQHAFRCVSLGRLAGALDRIAIGRHLSSSALAMTQQTLQQIVAAKQMEVPAPTATLLASLGIEYHRATWQARHVRLMDSRSQIFALAPVAQPQWQPTPLGMLQVRPVLHRHRLN